MERRMFLLDPQSVVALSPGPGDLDSRRGGGGRFFQAAGIGLSASVGGVHGTSFDGFGASSLCGVGRRASSGASAVVGIF